MNLLVYLAGACRRKGRKQAHGRPTDTKNRKKYGFLSVYATFLLYIVSRVPYDENDS
jgi:hypothetical protein